ncbi:bifunctional aspartate kinase/homoserine dehydrogenase II [Vibrio profundum]|uniref:bifunctional aspartate kinase/homoserine dehydrogenase II n=1 Tax=Vibrio profundum TaxID=2910247 RepID=UPI003D132ED0
MAISRQLHKFGGSSLADAECYLRVVRILEQYSNDSDLVVVSAAGKTTNQLIEFVQALEKDGRVAHETLQALKYFQRELLQQLLHGEEQAQLLAQLEDEIATLGQINAPVSSTQRAAILGHGEIWSSRLLAVLLSQHGLSARSQDSRSFLRAQPSPLPEVDHESSAPLLQTLLTQHPRKRLVITGFMAQDREGQTVLLGRNGSDYSATIIGALAKVTRVTIWSDVAGVYSADPRLVSDSCLLPLLRLDEASELARLAAPVLHSRTLQPVAQSNIQLHLRSSHQPESGSTHIERVLASGRGAKIVTSLDDVLLIQVTFSKEQDVSQQDALISQTLESAQLTPICYRIQPEQTQLQLAFTQEVVDDVILLLQNLLPNCRVEKKHGYSIVAAVGAGVTNNPSHCHLFKQHCAEPSLEFISHGQAGLSLIAVFKGSVDTTLVESLHRRLFQARKRLAIALCGKGNIGSNWLSLFSQQKSHLEKRHGISVELVAVIASQRYWYDASGIDANQALIKFDAASSPYEGAQWIPQLGALQDYDDAVVLDLTASSELASQYSAIAEQGLHLISANKIAGSASSQDYYQTQHAFEKINRHWLYNATVGAGLPINHTVRDLTQSGDHITALSGIFSGTLSWLFQQYDGSVPFAELLELAWQQGLTEPDPRNDLDGSDVMRKLVILAREAGLPLEPEQVRVDSLVPEALSILSVDDFLEHGDTLSAEMARKLDAAQQDGKVLRYIARLDKQGKASVGLEAIYPEHALANLLPCDNIFAIESQWYKDNPLVIRGPGAGKDVTAGAVQSDLNRLARLIA